MSSRKVYRRFRPGEGPDAPAEIEPIGADDAAPAAEPEVVEEPAPRLETDDLEALANMDPSELAALMEGSIKQAKLEPGDKIEGTIARVTRDTLFVELGGKAEGVLDRAEAPDAQAGDTIIAFVLQVGDLGVRLSTKLSGEAAIDHLEEARESGIPVEGRVESRNKGGFEVRIGSVRAFCPMSMISRLPDVDMDSYIGQTLPFRVIETGDKIVVNRRVLQEEEVEEKAAELWISLNEGDEIRGTVRNVQPFGAFVDVGGIDGLVPRSEISWERNADPLSVFTRGQSLEVRVLQIDRENKKLTLSARNPETSPWNAVGVQFVEGGIYDGIAVKSTTFGTFVELAPGLQGLVHISKTPSGPPKDGSTIHVRIQSIDHERHRLSLVPVAEGAETQADHGMAQGTISAVMKNGVAVQLDDGRSGWLSAGEVDLPPGTVLAQRFRRGKVITARITGVNGDRVTLSTRADENSEQREWRQHRAASKEKSAASFGTLGDLLGGLNLPK